MKFRIRSVVTALVMSGLASLASAQTAEDPDGLANLHILTQILSD